MKTHRSHHAPGVLLLALLLPAAAAPGAQYAIPVQPGLNLIANHLDRGGNIVAEVLPDPREGDVFMKWNPSSQAFISGNYELGEWSPEARTTRFAPGEALFLQTSEARELTFLGTPRVPVLPLPLEPGRLHFVGRQTTDAPSSYEDIVGLPPVDGVELHRWEGDAYTTNRFLGGQWLPDPPAIRLGEGVVIRIPATPPPQPPVITQPPRGGTLVPGESLTLGVTATGTGTLRYQWIQLGTPPVPRGTDPALVLGPVTAADAGEYVVEVRDDVDAVTSAPATVVVVAPGGFYENFEGYRPGADLLSGGGWHGWAEDPAAGGLVQTERAFSPTRAVCVQGTGDLARRIAGVTGGQWVLTLRQFIPSSSVGTHYVNVLNRYRPPYGGEDLSWSIQIQCVTATGRIISDLGGGASLPLIKDEWIEIRCEIDLAANTVRKFYHGELLAEHPWRGSEGDLAIAALNLYAHGSGPACYDDVRLEQAQPPVITQQPQSLTVTEGAPAIFTVVASGAEPLAFQWLFDGIPLHEATNSTLRIQAAPTNASGQISVQVSNPHGMAQSQAAPFTVQPASQQNAEGTVVEVNATICFNNPPSGAVADCIAAWGGTAFRGGTYTAAALHTRKPGWCLLPGSGGFSIISSCPFDDPSEPASPISASGPLVGSGQSINTPLRLLGHNSFSQDHCGPPCWSGWAFGWQPEGYGYVHRVTATMRLGNGDWYLFAPKDSPPLGGQQLPPPCGPCPPEPMTICECPTVVELCFVDCRTGLPLPINLDSFQATLLTGPQSGQPQAWGTTPTNNVLCRKMLLRSGERYSVTMDYHTGGSYFNDRINWRRTFEVDTRNHDCANDGVQRVVVECLLDPDGSCTRGGDPCPISVKGNLNLLCECEHSIGQSWSLMSGLGGPWGIQQRYAHLPLNPTCSEGPFTLPNLLAGQYTFFGQMAFRAGHNYQWLRTPSSSHGITCDNPLDLGDTFVLDCGWVRGDIFLCGPTNCIESAPCGLFSYLKRELNPESSGSQLGNSSYLEAFGPAGGWSRAQFPGAMNANCEFRGNYNLSLGGLNRGASTWTANRLVLRLDNAASPFLNSTIEITDRLFPAQNIVPGNTVVNDHNYCFGTVTLKFNVQGVGSYTPSVRAVGAFGPALDFQANPADYAVNVNAAGPSGANPNAVIMSLPEGVYDFFPSAQFVGFRTDLLPIKGVRVSCKQCITVCPTLRLEVGELDDCVKTNRPTLSVRLFNDDPVTLEAEVNNGAPVPLGSFGANAGTVSVTLPPAAALGQCANTITIRARDNQTSPCVASETVTIVFDDVPPNISGCQDIHVTVPAGKTGANVSWPPITATDNCSGPLSVTTSHASGSQFPLGVTVVTATAVDACGNASTCQFKVTVQDCVGIIGVSSFCGQNSDYLVTFTYENPGPDPVTWLMLSPLSSCASVTPTSFHFPTPIPPGGKALLQMNVNLPPGCPTRLCFQATALNAAREECCSVERCIDLIGINCPEDIVVDCQDERGAWVEWDPITISSGGLGLPVICSHSSGWFPIGVTRVTCTFVDECDRQRTCEFTVCVRASGPGVWSRARNDEAQSPATNASQGLGIATDRLGNVVYAGSFQSQIRITGTLTLNAVGQRDGYLVKEDPAGTVLWAVKMGTAGDDEARSVVTDDSGNIYVTGQVDGARQVVFDSWPAIPSTGPGVPSNQQDIFVACYNPNGSLQWYRRLGDNGDDGGIDIAINPQGDPIAVGQWTVNGSPEAFVARLNRSTGTTVGSILWSSGGAGRAAAARGVAVDGLGNVYIVGNHAGPTDFPPLSGPLPSGGFVAKADPTLSGWLWARETYGNADLRAVALDPTSGDLFLTGYFNGMVRLDKLGGGQLSLFNSKSGSLYDYLIARLDPAGGLATWLIKGGGSPTAAEETRDIAMDDLGNCYVTGFLHANAPSPWVGTGQRVLVANYNGQGHIRWTRHADGGASPAQAGNSLAVDGARCVHVTGEFAPTLSFPNPSFAPSISGLTLPAGPPPPLGQTWVGRICPVCPCQDTEVTRFDKNISTGWNNTAVAWTPPGSNDDEWVWVDTSTGNTSPATVAGPPGSPPAAPISILGVHPVRLRYCLGLPAGCLAERIEITVASANPDPAGIKVFFNSQLIASGPGMPGFALVITSGFISNNDCLEIEVNQDYPVAVAGTVSAICGCGEIAGAKFDDQNRDGIRGGSEPGLSDWLITLTDNTGNIVRSALTGTGGTYQSGLMFGGTYQVCEVQQSGWHQSYPAVGCHSSVQVVPGSGATGVDFGNYRVDFITWDPTVLPGNMTIIWSGDGTLHNSTASTGPWQVVPGATSPYVVPTTNAPQQFFQVTWP